MKSDDIIPQNIDYKAVVYRFLRMWKAFVVMVFIMLTGAYFYIKFTMPSYENYASILIEKDKASLLQGEFMQGFDLLSGQGDMETQMDMLTSFPMIYETLAELNLEVSYYKKQYVLPFLKINKRPLVREEELYKNSPINVVVDREHLQPIDLLFRVQILDNKRYQLRLADKGYKRYHFQTGYIEEVNDSVQYSGIHRFGEKCSNKDFGFTVFIDEKYAIEDYVGKEILFAIHSMEYLVLTYIDALGAEASRSGASIIYLSLGGTNIDRITDFLNTLTKVYLEYNLNKKNKIATTTIQFIDSQITNISDSLTLTEKKLQDFRSKNKVMNLTFQGEQVYNKLNDLEKQKALLLDQHNYFSYIRDYFNSNAEMTDLIAPSSREVTDPLLTRLIEDLIKLNSQRINLLNNDNTAPENLFLANIDHQITNLKKTIMENIDYNFKTAVLRIQELNKRIAELSREIGRLPMTERALVGIERKFKLNDAIYTYMLQKRAEAQIAKASSSPDFEVINEARGITAILKYPKKKLIMLLAFFMGLAIPFTIILLRDFLNVKIENIQELEKMSAYPVLGFILNNPHKHKNVVTRHPQSPVAETFRSVRTNLQFFSAGKKHSVILVTSSQEDEGKSFVAYNLAQAYSQLGKKTLLMHFDLRKTDATMGMKNLSGKGITDYLINSAQLDELIVHIKEDNLDVMYAGLVPPNPVELIAGDYTDDLFDKVNERYDYIIVDTPPVGVVTDAYLLMKYAQIKIYVVRFGHTHKELFRMNIKSMMDKGIKNLAVVFNGVKTQGHAYNYSYGYGNYEKKSFWKRIKRHLLFR